MIGTLTEGLSLMLIGMGTVLIFLCIMIVAMTVMSKAVAKLNTFFPEPVAVVSGAKKSSLSNNDDEIVAAIAAAMFGKK